MRNVVLVLSVILLIIGALPSSAIKTNKILVKLRPEASVEELSLAHPAVKFERASTLPRVFIFSVENINEVDQEAYEFTTDSRVAWAHIDEINELEPDFIPTDPSLRSGDQWFHDRINTSYAWSKGYSGQGQLVQVIDTPVYPEDVDLRNQIDFARSFGGTVVAPSGRPVVRPHGTICTNIIVAEANDFCGVGVAFSARAAIFPFIANEVRQFSELEVAEALALSFSVSSNSYGATQCWQSWGCNVERPLSPTILEALELAQTRNNTVFIFTAGNEGRWSGSPNFRAFGGTPRIITVGAARSNGTRALYSNVGPANWIVAPAGDNMGGGLVTWASAISSEGQQCGPVGTGTSYAAPMVAGAAAILRSAYPQLSWRDIKYILAYSADRVDPDHASWLRNAAGRWFSNHYGFGHLNVGKAVEIGATWQSVGPLQIRTFHSTLKEDIPLDSNNTVITPQITVPRGVVSRIESVQLTLDISLSRRGEQQIELISPSGTVCTVFAFRQDWHRNYRNYITSANCFLDEDPAGAWTLRVTRQSWSTPWNDFFHSFAVTVWGQAIPSQVQVVSPPTATRLTSFTVTEGDSFQHLKLFNNFPDTLGLFWRDNYGLYGELFTAQGTATRGTQRLNPSNSDHPTVSVFPSGDHVLTYVTNVEGTVTLKAEVRNVDFIPLTPLTDLPFTDINPEELSMAAIENNLIVSYKPSSDSNAKIVLLDVNFGSRDVTPVCIPFANVTTDDETGAGFDTEDNCTEIVYRRDGEIRFSKQVEIQTKSLVQLHPIGMNMVLGTWVNGQNAFGALIRDDLRVNVTRLKATPTSIISAAATLEDILIAHTRASGVLIERFDTKMRQQETYNIAVADPIVAMDLAYTHVDGLSLLVATKKDVSITTFLRSANKTFVQTNQATISSLLSPNFPVLDVDQSVLPNGDLAVTFSTIQEIHVQVFQANLFAKPVEQPPVETPVESSVPQQVIKEPVTKEPLNEDKPPKADITKELETRFPSWAIALIVIAGIMAVIFVIVFRLQRKNAALHQTAIQMQGTDVISYTKMNV